MKSFVKHITVFFYSILISLFGKKKEAEETVVIFSFPRSGSTWLMNIIEAALNSAILFEPVNPFQDKRFQPFAYKNKVYPSTIRGKEKQLKAIMGKLLLGNLVSWWSLSHTSLKTFMKRDRLTVKILRMNYVFDWVQQHFSKNKKVILLRHPCSVLNSMSKSPGAWHKIDKSHVRKIAGLAEMDSYKKHIEEASSLEELHLIMWCMEAKKLLSRADNSITLYYENLVTQKDEELGRLCQFLSCEVNENVIGAYDKVSNTTNKNSSLEHQDPLKRWQYEYDEDQKRKFQLILDAFEIRCYNTSNHLPN